MRINRLRAMLKEKNIDLALIFSINETPDTNLYYFTNYLGIGVLAVLQDKSFLLVPEMEYEKALVATKGLRLKVFKTEKKKKLLETLSLHLKIPEIKKIGIDEEICSVHLFKKLKKAFKAKYVDVGGVSSQIRMIKEDNEIIDIKRACEVTDIIFKKIYTRFTFKTESEVKEFIKEEFSKYNCEMAFPPIVASGINSCQPHYVGNEKIKRGFLLLDFGAKYKSYCSDMTRMLYVGIPNKKELKDYALVLNTLSACEEAVEKTKKYSSLFNLSLKNLDTKSKFFTHSLGHGIGLDVHEMPSLNLEDKTIIQNNIPFTIEPGIYFPKRYGIRIEDTMVLINNKLQVLTRSKKEFVIIHKLY